MYNHRNIALSALVGGLVFVCLSVAARLPTLDAILLAAASGGAVLIAVSRQRQPPEPVPVTFLQFQTQPITGIRLPTALADYHFEFAASVMWLPSADAVHPAGDIAVNEVLRRACKITQQRNPGEATLAASDLSVALGVLLPDPTRRVQARAESVHLQLPPEDQQRLDEFANLRKDEGLWEYQRRSQMSRRHYLRTDVLKDAGSAVVWWMAKHEDNLEQVGAHIGLLTQLAHAANNNHLNGTDRNASDEPPTPSERFDAFLDSLNPAPSDDVRLTLTYQMARLVNNHDQKTAHEMRLRYSEPDASDATDGNQAWSNPPPDELA